MGTYVVPPFRPPPGCRRISRGLHWLLQRCPERRQFSWASQLAALSLLRVYMWGLNPKSDDAPPFELVLKLDEEPILPTCNLYSNYIEESETLPLTQASQFLNSVTSFAGLVDRFEHPDLTLYYTLTRKGTLGVDVEMSPAERILYVTVFDHKECTTTIVYTQQGAANHYHLTQSSIPFIDLEHDLLEVKLGKEMDSGSDPIVGDDGIRRQLENHYRSIRCILPLSERPTGMTNIESRTHGQ